MLSKLSILHKIYQALEVGQFPISEQNPKLNKEFQEIFYFKNTARFKDDSTLSEKEIQLTTISIIFTISERLKIFNSKNIQNSVFAFFQTASNLIDILQKQLFCEYSDDAIFLELLTNMLIPAFVNLLDTQDLKIVQKLIPTENETFADKFIDLTGITKNIEDSSLFEYFSPDDLDSDTKERKKLQENFRILKQTNQLPTNLYISKVYQNSPMILKIFTYSKLLNYFAKLDNTVLGFTRKLIEDKLNHIENKILYQNEGDIINSIFINLALKKNIYFANLDSVETNSFLKQSYEQEKTCRILNKLRISLKDKKIDILRMQKAPQPYKYNGVSIISQYKNCKTKLLIEAENSEIDGITENILLDLSDNNYTSIKSLLKQYFLKGSK